MKYFPFLLLMLCIATITTQAQQVTHVITHDRTTIVTDPSKGANPYPAWGGVSIGTGAGQKNPDARNAWYT